jgi:hypothetical protein
VVREEKVAGEPVRRQRVIRPLDASNRVEGIRQPGVARQSAKLGNRQQVAPTSITRMLINALNCTKLMVGTQNISGMWLQNERNLAFTSGDEPILLRDQFWRFAHCELNQSIKPWPVRA